MMQRIFDALEQGRENMHKEIRRAEEEDDEGRLKRLHWLNEKLGEATEVLRAARRHGGPERGREGMRERFAAARAEIAELLRRADRMEEEGEHEEARELREKAKAIERELHAAMERGEGRGRPGEERPEFRQHMRELMMALRRAEEEGDREKAAEIRRELAELRERMGERRGERGRGGWGRDRDREADRDRDRPREGDTDRLRREIDDLKKELGDLKKLLRKLLKEKGKEKD
jgi:hypothetical protein